jgi:hypothetical protein
MKATEPWRWGDLFELDVPLSAIVSDLGEMIELRFDDRETPLLLAAFAPLTDGPEQGLRAALERFAVTRGFPLAEARGGLELSRDPEGLIAGRIAFVSDLHWMALGVAWLHGAQAGPSGASALVVGFVGAPGPDDPIFDAAESLFGSLRPLDRVISTAPPAEDPSGDF